MYLIISIPASVLSRGDFRVHGHEDTVHQDDQHDDETEEGSVWLRKDSGVNWVYLEI